MWKIKWVNSAWHKIWTVNKIETCVEIGTLKSLRRNKVKIKGNWIEKIRKLSYRKLIWKKHDEIKVNKVMFCSNQKINRYGINRSIKLRTIIVKSFHGFVWEKCHHEKLCWINYKRGQITWVKNLIKEISHSKNVHEVISWWMWPWQTQCRFKKKIWIPRKKEEHPQWSVLKKCTDHCYGKKIPLRYLLRAQNGWINHQ